MDGSTRHRSADLVMSNRRAGASTVLTSVFINAAM
jgi:hypothetical protein